MPIRRRALLKTLGAAAVVVTAGGAAFVLTRTPASALAPWKVAGEASRDPRIRALSYAILAPNPHNRQPWLVELGNDDALALYCDPGRLLPETDPYGRQIVIGLGCFLELLRLAAAEDGYEVAIAPFPDGASPSHPGAGPIAHVRFRRAERRRPDPLFGFVLQRRSNKEPFDTGRRVDDGALSKLAAAAGGGLKVEATNEPGRVGQLRELTWQAMRTEITTPRTYLESVRLMRIGKAEIEVNPDGIDLGGPFLESLSHLGLLSRETLADPQSTAFRQGLDMFAEITGTAMAHIWIKTRDNSRLSQLAAGRAWLRLNLKATALGLAIHPLSQALQEYPEMEPHFRALDEIVATRAGERVQMLGRLGYGPEVAPSPRWPLETRIRKV